MNQEIKTKWLEALRSGEYNQSKHQLRSKDGYCCLGVLCDVYRKETGLLEWVEKDNYFSIMGTTNFTTLNEDVMNWAELPINSPMVSYNSIKRLLTAMNDNGISFNEIADVIEGSL